MKRPFLADLLQAAGWSLVSTGAALVIIGLIATTFLHGNQ